MDAIDRALAPTETIGQHHDHGISRQCNDDNRGIAQLVLDQSRQRQPRNGRWNRADSQNQRKTRFTRLVF